MGIGLYTLKKKIDERIFDIFILSGDIEPGKSSCLPSGKISQNSLARLQGAGCVVWGEPELCWVPLKF